MTSQTINSNNSAFESGRLSPLEQKQAEETTKEAVEEAKKYSNPNIPLHWKILGGIGLALLIWKTG